jgi:hypothetical protein
MIFYSLGFYAIPIICGLFFQSWPVFICSLILHIISAFLLALLFADVPVSSKRSIGRYLSMIACGLFFGGVCVALGAWLHSLPLLMVLLGSGMVNYALGNFLLRGCLHDQKTALWVGAIVFGGLWGFGGWLAGHLLSSLLSQGGLLALFCSILLAVICFLIGFVGHLKGYDWFYCFLEDFS